MPHGKRGICGAGVALGGFEMMQRAAEAVKKSGKKTKLIAVTILTSHDQNVLDQDLKIKNSISKSNASFAIHIAWPSPSRLSC